MSRRDKLIEKIRRRPPEASYRDVRKLLEEFGWVYDRTEGSHSTFTKPREYPIVVAVHNKRVKRAYLDDICERLQLDEIDED